MEINSTYPIFVTFSCHNVLFVLKVPNLPSTIITCSCYYLLLGVKSHTTDTSWFTLRMCFNLLIQRHSLHQIIKCLREERIWSSILRPRCILAFEHGILFHLATHSLLLHTGINLSLNLLFMFGNCSLKISDFFLQLIFLKFEERLFFDSIQMLFLNLLNFLFVIFVQVLHFLDVLCNCDFL